MQVTKPHSVNYFLCLPVASGPRVNDVLGASVVQFRNASFVHYAKVIGKCS